MKRLVFKQPFGFSVAPIGEFEGPKVVLESISNLQPYSVTLCLRHVESRWLT